jgi:hypothetical protein
MSAGVRDVLPRDFDETELREAVKRAASQVRPDSTAAEESVTHRGHIVTIFSSKGGSGKSLVASNLAVLLARETKQEVALVDLDLGSGDLAIMFQIMPSWTIHDAAQKGEALDIEALTGYMTKHSSGVDLLAAPPEPSLGLKLFIGEGSCVNCHNGPLFTDNHFHNTGVPAVADLPEDLGRALAVQQVAADPFNCLGAYSDAGPADCAELKYMTTEGEELLRAFKTPSLRGVAQRSPYMHAGQVGALVDVLDHYNSAPSAPAGHSELEPLSMSAEELAALEAFLRTLDYEP